MRIRSLAVGRVATVLERLTIAACEHGEVCGLLGGYLRDIDVAVATAVHPLPNLSLRRTSFAIDVDEFCRARDEISTSGQLPLALYHSHPNGLITPSFRDRELPRLTDLLSLILAWNSSELVYRCFGDTRDIPVTIVIDR